MLKLVNTNLNWQHLKLMININTKGLRPLDTYIKKRKKAFNMTPLNLDPVTLKTIENKYDTFESNDYEIYVSNGLGVDITIRRNDDMSISVIHDTNALGPEVYTSKDELLLDTLDRLSMDDTDFLM